MPSLLDCTVEKQAWLSESTRKNGSTNGNLSAANQHRSGPANAERWEERVNELVEMQHLGENWDGLGAHPPTLEMLACAIGLASLLEEGGMDPPNRVVSSTAGTVVFEWQAEDGSYAEIEIDQPFHAEVMFAQPGKEPQHWELPTQN